MTKKYCIFYANNLLIDKFTPPTSHTSNTVDIVWTCKHFHDGAVAGMPVVVLLLPLSSSMYDDEFDHGCGGGSGGGLAAAAVAAVAVVVVVVVVAVEDNYRRKRPETSASTIAWRHVMTKADGGQQGNNQPMKGSANGDSDSDGRGNNGDTMATQRRR
jgi:hypothetical protein